MKYQQFLCVTVACLISTVGLAATANINYATPNEAVFANHGVITLNLKSNPTTGYFWRWAPQGSEVNDIAQVTKKYIAFPHAKGFVGGGGYEQWVFTLNKKLTQVPTQMTLHMIYGRMRMPVNTPAQTYTIMIMPHYN